MLKPIQTRISRKIVAFALCAALVGQFLLQSYALPVYAEDNISIEEIANDAGESEVKAGESEVKAGESEAKAGESEVKAGESEAKAGESEAKAGESEAKAGESEAKTEEEPAKPAEEPEKAEETEEPKNEPKVKIKADSVVIALGAEFDLMEGVSAKDEDGEDVEVKVIDDGGFDADKKGTYTAEYEAVPAEGESVTYKRTVTVYPFDKAPKSLEEVKAAIEAWEKEEAAKPCWQEEPDSSMLPAGWRFDCLEEEVDGITVKYWSVFLEIMSMAMVHDYDTLVSAINSAADGEVIEIKADITLSNTITVPSGKKIKLISEINTILPNKYTLKIQSANKRHFEVKGELVIEDIIIDGTNQGGGIVIDGGTLTMESGAVIKNCKAHGYGGGVYVKNGTFTMNAGEISKNNNTAGQGDPSPGGGVLVGDNGEFTMAGGKIIDNESCNGAGVYLGDDTVGTNKGQFTMTGGEISGNKSMRDYGGFGAGVNAGDGIFTMQGGTITGNEAKSYGGGVYVGSGTFTMSAGTISSNKSSYVGGGIAMVRASGNNGTVNISGTALIENNTAVNGNSGGIHVYAGGTLTMNGGTVKNNTAKSGGGIALRSTGVKFDLISGTIENNTASESGGGVYVENAAFNMTGGTIGGAGKGNTATNTGGGIALKASDAQFDLISGTIENNTAEIGGGVHLGSGTAFNMTGGEINGNTAMSDDHTKGEGGGIAIDGGTAEITNGEIKDNKAVRMGGGIYLCGKSKLKLNDSSINENKSTQGAGVYVGEEADVTMVGGEISQNKAKNIVGNPDSGFGGGVYLTGTFDMTNGKITDNEAFTRGGGLQITHEDSSSAGGKLTMTGGEISGNGATGGHGNPGGGGIAFVHGTAEITNGVIKNNTADVNGGGIQIIAGKIKLAGNCEVTGNTATAGDGGGIYVALQYGYAKSYIETSAGTKFAGNKAAGNPTNNHTDILKSRYPHIQYMSTSATGHPLNNWDINWGDSYIVNYNKNTTDDIMYNGQPNKLPEDNNLYKSGVKVTVSTDKINRAGYDFKGWSQTPAGNAITEFNISADTTLYAVWQAKPQFSVTYHANGADSGTVPTDSNTYYEGQTVMVAGNSGTLKKTGYVFAGWMTNPNIPVPVGTSTIMGDGGLNLYAIWKAAPLGDYTLVVYPATVEVLPWNDPAAAPPAHDNILFGPLKHPVKPEKLDIMKPELWHDGVRIPNDEITYTIDDSGVDYRTLSPMGYNVKVTAVWNKNSSVKLSENTVIRVVDITAPVINVGRNLLTFERSSSAPGDVSYLMNLAQVTVADNYDKSVTVSASFPDVASFDRINWNYAGEYTMLLNAVDSSGNIAAQKMVIIKITNPGGGGGGGSSEGGTDKPDTDRPSSTKNIGNSGTPLAKKTQPVVLGNNDVPKAKLPKTGGNSGNADAKLMLQGIYTVIKKKREKAEQE